MPKPITDWGEDELRAVFGCLPEGSLIATKGNHLIVANLDDIKTEFKAERGGGGYIANRYGDGFIHRSITVTADLVERGKGQKMMVTLAPSVEDSADMRLLKYADSYKGKEVKAALKRLLARGYRLRYA